MKKEEFDALQISSRIYEKLKIPHYRLTDFLGYSKDFDLGINETIDTFETGISAIEREKQAIIDIEGKPRHRDLLPFVEEGTKDFPVIEGALQGLPPYSREAPRTSPFEKGGLRGISD